MVYAFFKLVTRNMTPKMLAEQKGVKIYRHNWPVHYHMNFKHFTPF